MIKTLKTMSKQEKERYTVPRKVQDVIPVRRFLRMDLKVLFRAAQDQYRSDR